MNVARKILVNAGVEPAFRSIEETFAHISGRDHWGEAALKPTRCVGAVTHWRAEGREPFLIATVRALLTQSPMTSVAVFTNDASGVAEVLSQAGLDTKIFRGSDGVTDFLLGKPKEIACVQWWGLEREHPFRLTWAHKRIFREIVQECDAFASGLSHLVYIEDDLGLPPGALDYWCALRPILASRGLIPAFTRSEGPDEDLRLTSPERPYRIDELPGFALPAEPGMPERRIVNMHYPYQGFYILDAPLARYHFTCSSFRTQVRSKLSRTLGGTWGVREQAAAGAVFDRIPPGYRSRNALLLERNNAEHFVPVAPALVRHLPANYYADPASKKAKIPLVGAFVG